MTINFTGRKVNLRDSFRETAEKKLLKLAKYFSDSAEAHVTVTLIKNSQEVEVTIRDQSLVLRAEESSADMLQSLDKVIDILTGQIRKHKTKLDKKLRSGSLSDLYLAPEEEPDYDVVKTKRFPIKPLHLDEAILQMNLVGHKFFVFKNPDTLSTNVVYRRDDGKYGLIEPEDAS